MDLTQLLAAIGALYAAIRTVWHAIQAIRNRK